MPDQENEIRDFFRRQNAQRNDTTPLVAPTPDARLSDPKTSLALRQKLQADFDAAESVYYEALMNRRGLLSKDEQKYLGAGIAAALREMRS